MTQHSPDQKVANIVATGKLRVALFLPLFTKDPVTGEVQTATSEGAFVSEIARALAARLGVSVQLFGYPTPAEAIEALKAGACDLMLIGIDPKRANELDFSPQFIQKDFTFLVPAGSPIRTIAEADRPDVRVAAVRNHHSTKTLSDFLNEAQLVHADTFESAVDLLRSGEADAFASVRTALLEFSTGLPGSRVLEDRYGELLLAIAIPKGHPDWLVEVTDFVEDAKASGLIQRAVDSSGSLGVQVSPPAARA